MALQEDLRTLSLVRKREFERNRSAASPPERFWTLGGPYDWTPILPGSRSHEFARTVSGSDDLAGTDVGAREGSPQVSLKGIGCYPGLVRARAQVVEDTSQPGPLEGAILVAKSNDPGWVPLYSRVAGIALERGSILSHTANMAREMNIPAVLGVQGLMSKVRTGMLLELDGTHGLIRIMEDSRIPEDD